MRSLENSSTLKVASICHHDAMKDELGGGGCELSQWTMLNWKNFTLIVE